MGRGRGGGGVNNVKDLLDRRRGREVKLRCAAACVFFNCQFKSLHEDHEL